VENNEFAECELLNHHVNDKAGNIVRLRDIASLVPEQDATKMSMQRQLVLLVALIFGFLPVSFGQFNFFDMFGQHRHHEPQHPPSGTSQWAAHSENGISIMYVIQMYIALIFI
jgi:hypothetical protein